MKLLKVTGFIVAVIVVLLAVVAAMLNSDTVQNRLMQRAVAMLREQLQTEVRVGHVSVNLFKGSLALHDVEVDDRQGRKMLRMERLTALDPAALWRREVVITDAHADGLKALLCKPAAPTDSTPNFHFLVEAFKSPKTHSSQKARPAQRPFSLLLETATIDIDSLCYTTDIDFHFDIDERNKYLSGTASTDSLQLGRIMDMKELGRIACRAAFRFDISKPRTAQMRRVRGGKLPIGNVEAQVSECHYKLLSMHHLSATIDSDGAEATGRVVEQGKLVDLACNFSFTDTDQMHHLKVKPGIRFHRKNKKATAGP